MTEKPVLSQEEGIKLVQKHSNRMAVVKIPLREKIEKAIAGQEYFCSDEGKKRIAEDGMCFITRELPNGQIDTYMNKKGNKYVLENGKTWDDLAPGESAMGHLKGEPEYDRSAIWVKAGTRSQAVWDEVQVAQGSNAFLTTIYENNPNAESPWDRTQTVINNNACDTHPVDLMRRDEKGNPKVIGVMPLTADLELREAELRAYVELYYNGEMPKHLLPIIRNINAQKSASRPRVRTIGKEM